jgi:hypothetical protein
MVMQVKSTIPKIEKNALDFKIAQRYTVTGTKDKHFSLFTIPKNSRERINYPYLSNMLVFFSSMMSIVPVNCDFRNFPHECDN